MHTNSFAEPASVCGDDLVGDVMHLVDINSEAVEEELDRLAEEFLENVVFKFNSRVERPYRNQWMPAGLLQGRAPSIQALEALVAAIEPRWRLDAILALQDLTLRDEDA